MKIYAVMMTLTAQENIDQDSSRTDTDSRAPQAKKRLPVGSGAILEICHTSTKMNL